MYSLRAVALEKLRQKETENVDMNNRIFFVGVMREDRLKLVLQYKKYIINNKEI